MRNIYIYIYRERERERERVSERETERERVRERIKEERRILTKGRWKRQNTKRDKKNNRHIYTMKKSKAIGVGGCGGVLLMATVVVQGTKVRKTNDKN